MTGPAASPSMSALRPSGSTRQWRELVAWVLSRPGGRVCRMLRDGRPCGAYATTVQHVVPRWAGGTDDPRNLIPACGPCNYSERHRPPDAGTPVALTARQAAVVELLDAYGLSCTGGRRQAAALMTRWAAPLRASGADLDTACAYRRSRGPLTRM